MKDKIKLGAAYIRESTKEQDKGYSPGNQKAQIEDYAKRHNIKIVEWYKDLITGTSAVKRDDFQRMIEDAMQHKFEVILVFHTSRFARSIQDSRQYKTLLRKKLGIDVISTNQHFGDSDDPNSFLNEGVNELFDEYTSKNISFWVRSNLLKKRSEGKQNGNPPLGYYKKRIGFDKDKERPIYAKDWLVHPEETKIVKKIFTLYATGTYSFAHIATELNKSGVKTKYGYPFTYSAIKDTLDNKVYLGLVCSRRKSYLPIKGVHKAIIGQKLFDKAQEALKARRNTKGRPVAQHRFYLLQDLVCCYNCKKHLKGKEDKPNSKLQPKMFCQTFSNSGHEYLTYGCKFRKETGTCKQPYVRVEVIDHQVLKYMEGFNIPDDIIEKTIVKLNELFKEVANSPREINKVAKLKARRKKLNFIYTHTDNYTEEEYLTLDKEIEGLINKYDQLGIVKNNSKIKSAEYIRQTEKFLREYKQFLNTLDNREKREWLLMTLKRVWVQGDKVVAIEPKDDFKPLFSSHREVLVQAPSATPYKER